MVAFLLVTIIAAAAITAIVLYGPSLHVIRGRERIDQEARLAQWQMQQLTSAAMQRLLEEARQR